MALLQSEPKWTGTEGHQNLTQLLTELGFSVEEEVSFPPYTVDCYVESLHVAFEFDGPHHSQRRDSKRDDQLLVWYALPVVRVTQLAKEDMLRELAVAGLECWKPSADIRRNIDGKPPRRTQ
jgi:hypothetical protein